MPCNFVVFSKDNVVITPISPLHYWLPICKNSKQQDPALVAHAMAQQLGISGEARLEHLGDHSRCTTADGLHITKCYGLTLATCVPLSPDTANGPHTPRWYSAMHFLAIIAQATGDITLQPKLKLNWCTANFLLQGLIGTTHATHPVKNTQLEPKTHHLYWESVLL